MIQYMKTNKIKDPKTQKIKIGCSELRKSSYYCIFYRLCCFECPKKCRSRYKKCQLYNRETYKNCNFLSEIYFG